MKRYPEDAWEWAMKVQEVILWAMAKKLTWWQAAAARGDVTPLCRVGAAVLGEVIRNGVCERTPWTQPC